MRRPFDYSIHPASHINGCCVSQACDWASIQVPAPIHGLRSVSRVPVILTSTGDLSVRADTGSLIITANSAGSPKAAGVAPSGCIQREPKAVGSSFCLCVEGRDAEAREMMDGWQNLAIRDVAGGAEQKWPSPSSCSTINALSIISCTSPYGCLTCY
jgi:hypothetical protein